MAQAAHVSETDDRTDECAYGAMMSLLSAPVGESEVFQKPQRGDSGVQIDTGHPRRSHCNTQRANPSAMEAVSDLCETPLLLVATCVRLHALPNGWHGPLVRARLALASDLGEARGLPVSRSARAVPGFHPDR